MIPKAERKLALKVFALGLLKWQRNVTGLTPVRRIVLYASPQPSLNILVSMLVSQLTAIVRSSPIASPLGFHSQLFLPSAKECHSFTEKEFSYESRRCDDEGR
jgi:hypothetical protein